MDIFVETYWMTTPKEPPVLLVVNSADMKLVDVNGNDHRIKEETWALFAPSVERLFVAISTFPVGIIRDLPKTVSPLGVASAQAPAFDRNALGPAAPPQRQPFACLPNIPAELIRRLIAERHIEPVYAHNMADIKEKLIHLRHGQVPKGEFFWISTPGPLHDPDAPPLPLRVWRSERMMSMAKRAPHI